MLGWFRSPKFRGLSSKPAHCETSGDFKLDYFGKLPEAVIRDRRLTDYDLVVYAIISCKAAGRSGWYMSQDDIAEMRGTSSRAIRRALPRLRAAGLIETQKGPGGLLRYSLTPVPKVPHVRYSESGQETNEGGLKVPDQPVPKVPQGGTQSTGGEDRKYRNSGTPDTYIRDTPEERGERKEKKRDRNSLNGSHSEGSASGQGSTLDPFNPQRPYFVPAAFLDSAPDIPPSIWESPTFESSYAAWEATRDEEWGLYWSPTERMWRIEEDCAARGLNIPNHQRDYRTEWPQS